MNFSCYNHSLSCVWFERFGTDVRELEKEICQNIFSANHSSLLFSREQIVEQVDLTLMVACMHSSADYLWFVMLMQVEHIAQRIGGLNLFLFCGRQFRCQILAGTGHK